MGQLEGALLEAGIHSLRKNHSFFCQNRLDVLLTTSSVYYRDLVAIVVDVRIRPLNFKSLLLRSLVSDFSLFLSLDLIAGFIPEKKTV